MNTFVEIFLAQWVRLEEANFMKSVILEHPPLVFSANRKKTVFRENPKWQKCVFGHFLTSDVIHIFFLCRILKSTYRTNETFFSRTHSFGYSFQVWVGGWLIKVLKMVKTMLRMKTLVWYTDGPWWVVFAHCVQQSATLHPRRRDLWINFIKIRYKCTVFECLNF